MSPDKLVNKLEALGSIDRKIIKKLREQIQSADKPLKSTSILKYLVKKGFVSEAVAKDLLKSDKQPTATGDHVETRIAEPGEIVPYEDDQLEVARVEQSLSEVIDAFPETKSKDLASRKDKSDTDHFGDTSASAITQSAAGEDLSALGQFRKNDQKNQWTSKWPWIGGISLVLLIGVVVALAAWFAGASAEEQYDAAKGSLDSHTYEDAIKKFDEFIEDNPSHKNIHLAKSYRVNAVLRSKYSSRNYSETITSGEELLPALAQADNTELPTIRDDIGLMLSESIFQESEKAIMLKELPLMETAKTTLDGYWEFVDNPLYLSGQARKSGKISKFLADFENNRRAVNGLIDKEKAYDAAIEMIKEMGAQQKTDDAFRNFIELTRDYPDLASRKELRETMRGISQAEQGLVIPIQEKISVTPDDLTQGIGRTVALSSTTGKPVNGLRGESLTAVVDGAAYGFDASNGSLLWRKFVGLQTTFQPKVFDDQTVILSDLKRFAVSRVNSDDGSVSWSANIGEKFHEPNVSEARVVITTASGKVILLDGDTGEMIGGAKLPQPANTGAFVGRLPVIYQTGSYSNLYAISTSTFDCRDVMYLGHARNSISVPPLAWSGYLIIVRNSGDYADLLVIKPDETGLNLEMAQVINRVTDAPISTPIRNFGRGLFLFADNGDMRVLELNPGNETNPVSVRVKKRFETDGQKAYATFQGTKLWAAGKGLRRYKVQRNLGQLRDQEVVEPGDTFFCSPILLDDNLFHVRRRLGSSMVSASLVNAKSLEPIWRTDFGGEVAGVVPSDNGLDVVSKQGDVFRVDRSSVESGIASAPVLASEVVENLSFDKLLPVAKDTLLAVGGGKEDDNNDVLSYSSQSGKSRLFKLGLEPGDRVSHAPQWIDQKMMIATRQGQIARINPNSGTTDGTPFLPPVSPGMTVPWHPLLDVGESRCVAAHAEVITGEGTNASMMYLLGLEGRSINKVAELEFDNSIVAPLAYDGHSVIGVSSGEESDALFAVKLGSDLTIDATQTLGARRVSGPWRVDNLLLLYTDQDQLVGFDSQLGRKWAIDIGNVKIAGNPVSINGKILVTLSNGRLHLISPQDGSQTTPIETGQPIAKSPVVIGDSLWIAGDDGTVHLLNADALK